MFTIPIEVASETDLYEPFDPTGAMLSVGLCDYIESFADDRVIGQEVRLELECAEPLGVARFESAYRNHVDFLIHRCRAQRAKRSANALRLLAIGVVFVLAGLVLSGTIGPVLAAIISTIGSFSIWEAASVWLEDIPSLRKRERVLSVCYRAELSVKKREIVN